MDEGGGTGGSVCPVADTLRGVRMSNLEMHNTADSPRIRIPLARDASF